jgi:hypothetical protein
MKWRSLVIVIGLIGLSCSDDSERLSNSAETLNETTTGAGFFEYSDYTPFNGRVLKIYYYIPLNVNTNSEILFVFHGNGRNAKDYRDAMITKADQYNFIVITPEFSIDNFPGGDAYNLGNVFTDGDNPSPSTLNSEDMWTFSVIEPLFDYIKDRINNNVLTYQVFGHSAGGQFAHRFTMFKPNARSHKIVASASGWYTVADLEVTFPYGFLASPLENMDLLALFQRKLIIQVGDLDNNPNAAGLRHNSFADMQGLNRLNRAQYFFDKASTLANQNNLEFRWELQIQQGANHNYEIASQNAADLIFN